MLIYLLAEMCINYCYSLGMATGDTVLAKHLLGKTHYLPHYLLSLALRLRDG